MIVAQRLHKGSCGSPRGADRLIADAINTTRRLPGLQHQKLLVLADSAFYGRPSIHAAIKAGAGVSVTARMTRNIRHAITTIPDTSWEAIEYTDALFDEDTQRWNSSAEVAEIPFVAFASKPEADQVPGRLVVRRIPELNNKNVDQLGLFDLHCFHAVFTTADPDLLDTVAADKTHRSHAVIDQVNADLKNSALAHMPSGKFTANASAAGAGGHAFNFTRTAGTIAAGSMARATTATIRHRIVAAPARVARRSRRLVLHLPECWKWESQ
ncbi:hypothetical protein CFAEC_10490 [Corynebacterium faecale]|nr:hypothetical protein CFAEC_10490 [Corynebacterium faecale]